MHRIKNMRNPTVFLSLLFLEITLLEVDQNLDYLILFITVEFLKKSENKIKKIPKNVQKYIWSFGFCDSALEFYKLHCFSLHSIKKILNLNTFFNFIYLHIKYWRISQKNGFEIL